MKHLHTTRRQRVLARRRGEFEGPALLFFAFICLCMLVGCITASWFADRNAQRAHETEMARRGVKR